MGSVCPPPYPQDVDKKTCFFNRSLTAVTVASLPGLWAVVAVARPLPPPGGLETMSPPVSLLSSEHCLSGSTGLLRPYREQPTAG